MGMASDKYESAELEIRKKITITVFNPHWFDGFVIESKQEHIIYIFFKFKCRF